MLVYSTTINEIYTHIHEAFAGQLVRKMIKQLGLKDYIKNHIYIGSEISGPSQSSNEVKLPILHENCFRCTIKYSTNPFGLKWDTLTPGQHMDPGQHRWDNMRTPPIFFDPLHRITLTERYMPCNIELDCHLMLVDRVVAFDVMNRFVATYVRGELMTLTDFSYNYSMPDGILWRFLKLADVIKLGQGTVLDWLYKCSNGQIGLIESTRVNNKSREVVVRKHDWDALASIDYVPDSPEFVGQGTSPDGVQLNFTVTLQFARMNMLYLRYPIVLNNTLIPEELVNVDLQDAYGPLWRFIQHPELAINPIFQFNKCLLEHPARNPWYDDWLPGNSSIMAAKSRPFFIGLATLDNRNCRCDGCKCDCGSKYTSVNIATDLDQYKLAPNVLEWYRKNAAIAFDADSKYSITVFHNNLQIDPRLLKFDGEVIKFPNCFGPDGEYHVVLSAATREFPDGSPWAMLILLVDIDVQKEQN